MDAVLGMGGNAVFWRPTYSCRAAAKPVGPQQLTAAYTANLCSVIALVGVILPLIPERKRIAALGLMPFMRFAGKYLMLSHLMVAVLTAFTAMSFGHCWGTQVQGSGLLVFIVSCFFFFRFTVKNDKACTDTNPYQ